MFVHRKWLQPVSASGEECCPAGGERRKRHIQALPSHLSHICLLHDPSVNRKKAALNVIFYKLYGARYRSGSVWQSDLMFLTDYFVHVLTVQCCRFAACVVGLGFELLGLVFVLELVFELLYQVFFFNLSLSCWIRFLSCSIVFLS